MSRPLHVDPLYQLMEAAKDASPILSELAAAYPSLSDAEQRIVGYILEHPRAVANKSAAEVAAAAGISQATLFRTFRQFSFGGYAALRDEVQRLVTRFGDRFLRPADARALAGDGLSPLELGVYAGVRRLLDAGSVNPDVLEQAADAIARANRLHVCGVGPVSSPLVQMTAATFQRLGRTCVTWTDTRTMSTEYQPFAPGDTVLVISHSGENEAIADFVAQANAHGATTVVLTNYPRSPVARQGHVVIATCSLELRRQHYDLLPRVAQLVLLQVLVNRVRAALEGRPTASRGTLHRKEG